MKTLKLKLTGVRPMLMQSAESMNLDTTIARERYELNAKIKEARKKKDDNFPELMKLQKDSMFLDWRAGIYHDSKGFYVPSDNIFKALENGARTAKGRKEILTQCLIDEDRVRIGGITQHKTLKAFYEDPQFSLPCTIRVPPRTGARNYTCKPMIPTGWTVEFTISHDDSVSAERLIAAAVNAGAAVGLCGWRPKFGRFTVEKL